MSGTDLSEAKPPGEEPETTAHILELWKTTVDVQQHFNTLAMQIRNYALTVLAAGLGAAGFALKEGFHLRLPIVHDIPLGTCLAVVVAGAWLAFFLMDYVWYHQFLIGAVVHGEALERTLQGRGLPAGLTIAISEHSKFKIFHSDIDSRKKMFAFYGVIFVLLVVVAIGSYWAQPAAKSEEPVQRVEILNFPKSSAAQELQTRDWPSVPSLNLQPNPAIEVPAATPGKKW